MGLLILLKPEMLSGWYQYLSQMLASNLLLFWLTGLKLLFKGAGLCKNKQN